MPGIQTLYSWNGFSTLVTIPVQIEWLQRDQQI